MELIKEEKKYWETVITGAERVNSEGDIIVPDVKPDVLKVLQIDARSVITDKGLTTGGLYVQGKIYVNILYLADGGEEETGCIKTVLDFRTKIDNPRITQDMRLKIESDVVKIDFILLNSRKLSIKAVVSVNYEITAQKAIEIPSCFDTDEGECIEKCMAIDTIGADEEYVFSVRGAVEVAPGKPSVKEVIKTDIKVIDREIKVVASKIIINGTLGVCALYFADNNLIDYCDGEMSFTEVFAVEEILEDDLCDIDMKIGEIDIDLAQDNDGDIRIINLECVVGINATAKRTEEIKYIDDCYCPGKKTEVSYEEQEVSGYVDNIKKETNERTIIECDENIPEISRIYNVVAEPEVTKCTVANGGVNVEGRVKIYILYLTTDSKCSVYSIKKDLPFEYYHPCESVKEGMECETKVSVWHLSYNLNSKGEIEIKYTLKQDIRITEKLNLKLISDAKTKDLDEDNDIKIYFLKKGDSLWSVGKKYGVKVGDIMEMNGLESDRVMEGQKLLIPLG